MGEPHPYLALPVRDRATWIAHLCDWPPLTTAAPFEVPWPSLRPGEPVHAWLIEEFRRLGEEPGARDRMRRSVCHLLATRAAGEELRDRNQVVGELLEVAGYCNFREIVEDLRGWIRADPRRAAAARDLDAEYRFGGGRVTLRETIWSILISWRRTEDLLHCLRRDLDRPEQGCQALCFGELGRLRPDEAIRLMPLTLSWPRPYWQSVLARFLGDDLGPVAAVAPEYLPAWSEALETIFYEPSLSRRIIDSPLREGFEKQDDAFSALLRRVGIEVHVERRSVSVRRIGATPQSPASVPVPFTLHGDLSEHADRRSAKLAGLTNQHLESDQSQTLYDHLRRVAA